MLLIDRTTSTPSDSFVPTTSPAKRRRRVLVSAFATGASGGSEVAIGWNLCRWLAEHHDVTVLCAPWIGTEDFRSRNDAYFKEHGPIPGLTLHYVEPPALSRHLQRGHMSFLKPLYYMGYAAWQRAALKEAQRLHAQQPFEIVHHLNMTGFREPGFLWKLGVPFVLGPVGGAPNYPWRYFRFLSSRDRVFYALRNWSNSLQKRLKRRPRLAAHKAAAVWAIGEENKQLVEKVWGSPAQLMLETGADVRPVQRPAPYDGARPLRLIWSGLHIGRKALPILLHAISKLPGHAKVELAVIGAGSETQHWQTLADQLQVNDRIQWKGSLLHADAMKALADADVLAFTSVQEGTPVVVLESLGLGVPVICHQACGMGLAVTDESGVRVPMVDPETSIERFAEAITRLATNPQELRQLSEGAVARAREISWRNIAAQMAGEYERILSVEARA